MIKYQKNMTWAIPYIESVRDLIPLDKITHIKGYRVHTGLNEESYGAALLYRGKFSINIRIYDLNYEKDGHKRARIAVVLDSLAHELSHTVHWSHTHDHFRLQARILWRFSKILEKQEIQDTSVRMKFNQL